MGQNLTVQIVSAGGGSQIGGSRSSLDVTAPVVIKASRGTLFTIAIFNPGSSASLIVNDCATIGAAASSNQILALSTAQLTSLMQNRASLRFNWPCLNGITVSAVPTGGQFSLAFS